MYKFPFFVSEDRFSVQETLKNMNINHTIHGINPYIVRGSAPAL